MPDVKVRGLTKKYGEVKAVDDVSFQVKDGEFLTLLGPSGCGKTTILRCIAGLEKVDGGEIVIGDQVVSSPKKFIPPEKRSLGMVFQSYAIWPHMTVFDNVAFGLKSTNPSLSKNEIKSKTLRALKLVSLEGLEHRPATDLSGGQQQRVAVARSLAYDPPVLLLDEPLSNLDARLRDSMRFELVELHRKLKITTIYVTHDQSEAMVLSNRIIIMNQGKITQIGAPIEIYNNPANKFVAEFLGLSNILRCRVIEKRSDTTVLAKTDIGVDLFCEGMNLTHAIDKEGYLLLRPERIKLLRDKPSPEINVIKGRIKNVAYLGNFVNYLVEAKGVEFRVQADPTEGVFDYNEEIVMTIAPRMITVLLDENR